ncbi:hypothetical protein [Palaeococcus sp. (in: euryarchaeotes)]
MDFSLFMERYGYKILLAVMSALVIIFIAVPIMGIAVTAKKFGLTFGAFLLIIALVSSLFFRRTSEAYAQAHGKYFYDNRKRR